MLLKAVLSAAFLALSANAAVIARADEKTFKFQVLDPKKGKLYLGAGGVATADESKAVICSLAADVLKCDGKGLPAYSGDMVKLAPSTKNSAGWSIDDNDNISWKAAKDIKFSVGYGSATDVWAETCPHHWQAGEHGTAKAIWIVPA
ncbi:hypothetical protein B0T16DRAFT_490486 [Cercophora newfieldiana]|uniref:Uncharacterized protein n=1 Tax=Cercophora newfieldiana TaxID=92897 RepID=A0AA39YHE6_9PEZI|nr:hypothetical protein B0T16DRAFT_490486 [Cercophora newfieldiana]